MKNRLVILLGVLLLAGPVNPVQAEDKVDTKAAIARVTTVVQVPVVLMPVSDSEGNLMRYAYLSVDLQIPSATDRWQVEERIPYIKDAFIRELHGRPNLSATPDGQVDLEGVRERLLASIRPVVPEGIIGNLVFRDYSTGND